MPALVVCQKMAVLKLGARLSHENMLTTLEDLSKLQELVLEGVSETDIVSDRLCLPFHWLRYAYILIVLHVIVWYSM